MFSLFAMLLSSIASFLFPVFASYKALKTSDPAQLTPWLMYWVVFGCCLLVESWFSFILTWVPFYSYIRLFFLLYLILPQTQGARIIYEEHVHPFLEEHETYIDDFIASAHERLKSAGLAYIRAAIEYLRTQVLGMPATEHSSSTNSMGATEPVGQQSYTQALLARFSVPTARWAAGAAGSGAGNAGAEFYNLLASAVSAATGAGGVGASRGAGGAEDLSASGNLIPPNLRNPGEKMSFIAAQRERLNIVLSALDREAQQLQQNDAKDRAAAAQQRASSMSYDGISPMDEDDEPTQRPPSGLSMWSGLSKSRSEGDFEKIDAESGAEDDSNLRRRNVASGTPSASSGGSWIPWGWGSSNDTAREN